MSQSINDLRSKFEAQFEALLKKSLRDAFESGRMVGFRDGSNRAPHGTVKKTVENILKEDIGMSSLDIVNKTGLKRDSVRGTLSVLKSEGLAEFRDRLWYRKSERIRPKSLTTATKRSAR